MKDWFFERIYGVGDTGGVEWGGIAEKQIFFFQILFVH